MLAYFKIEKFNNCYFLHVFVFKDSNAEVVESVLAQVTDSEIQSVVEVLDADSCDVLMKYAYRFMGEKKKNYPQLLKIHAQVTETAGIGSIVRALTDRKTV